MKLREFDAAINERCNIDDWTIITTEGKKVCCNLDKYLDDEIVDIYWKEGINIKSNPNTPEEVCAVVSAVKILTIAHHEVEGIDYEHHFYACFEGYDGKVTKVPCNTREEARETISRDGGEYRSIWTE